jgi:hypothetical protein
MRIALNEALVDFERCLDGRGPGGIAQVKRTG